jgi:lipoprotein-releasing system permease protein
VYKVLLCWRYLRTRFLALACIISVTLGVATLIVVNSVMSGFSEKLRNNLHHLLSDLVIESDSIAGFSDPKGKMARIMADPFLANHIEAMSESLEIFAMLQYPYPTGETHTRPVRLIGIDPNTRSDLGGFKDYLVDKSRKPDFSLPPEMENRWREREILNLKMEREHRLAFDPPPAMLPVALPGAQPTVPAIKVDVEPKLLPPQAPVPHVNDNNPRAAPMPAPVPMDDIKIPRGAIIGNLVAGFRHPTEKDENGKPLIQKLLHPGDPIVLFTVKGTKLEPAYDRFLVVDYVKTDMSEYDANLVFVDLKYLQQLRAMDDAVSNIQIKLKNYDDAPIVRDRLQKMFGLGYRVSTWEQKQGSLLAAIDIEKGILNFLLFMIIAVAGFGILAIFSMIVAEKTRDIGIMKSLGASNVGVMQIFLSYGLLLGVVGATLGTALGIFLTVNLNPIEKGLTSLTGRQIFDPSVYYFNEIPTHIDAWTVVLVNLGAVAIAVVFSILPALRAAMLHPVRALRYE